jgi:hypothetical protein
VRGWGGGGKSAGGCTPSFLEDEAPRVTSSKTDDTANFPGRAPRRTTTIASTGPSPHRPSPRSGGSWVESAICRSNAESARESPAFTFPVGLIALRKGTENAAELPREIYGCVGRAFFCSEEFLPFYNVKMA